jgi:hypothetical protein
LPWQSITERTEVRLNVGAQASPEAASPLSSQTQGTTCLRVRVTWFGWTRSTVRLGSVPQMVFKHFGARDMASRWDVHTCYSSLKGVRSLRRPRDSPPKAPIRGDVMRMRLRIAVGTITLLGLMVGASGSPAHPISASAARGDSYFFLSSGKCMDDPGGSTVRGTQLQQWTCNSNYDNPNQHFGLVLAGLNKYWFKNVTNGQCLTVSGGSTSNGAAIVQWPCGYYQDQYFAIIYHRPGTYPLLAYQYESYISGRCLNVSGYSGANGARIIQWDCSGAPDNEYLSNTYTH